MAELAVRERNEAGAGRGLGLAQLLGAVVVGSALDQGSRVLRRRAPRLGLVGLLPLHHGVGRRRGVAHGRVPAEEVALARPEVDAARVLFRVEL